MLTHGGVPPEHISAGVLSCPKNYTAGYRVRNSTGAQGDWTAPRLDAALRYLTRVGVPEVSVWPAAGWLDAADWYYPALKKWKYVM